MEHYRSRPEAVPTIATGADSGALIFYGLDRSGPSFEGRVFLNATQVTAATPCTASEGFVGVFTVFGHGGCVGGPGHCDPRVEPDPDFELRLPQGLPPVTKTVELSQGAIERLDTQETFTVTVLAVEPTEAGPAAADRLDFDSWRLTVYEP